MKDRLQPESIANKYRDQVTTQEYTAKTTIEGVHFIDVPHFTDDGGTFIEVARLTDGLHDWAHGISARQISFSEMLPGVIKGFHLHYNQEDVWFVPPSSRMLVGLHDARKGSPTEEATMRFVMGGGKAKLVVIPRGVAHGLRNIDDKSGFVFYLVSQQFDKDDPDERRLPWDLLGEEFWEVTKG